MHFWIKFTLLTPLLPPSANGPLVYNILWKYISNLTHAEDSAFSFIQYLESHIANPLARSCYYRVWPPLHVISCILHGILSVRYLCRGKSSAILPWSFPVVIPHWGALHFVKQSTIPTSNFQPNDQQTSLLRTSHANEQNLNENIETNASKLWGAPGPIGRSETIFLQLEHHVKTLETERKPTSSDQRVDERCRPSVPPSTKPTKPTKRMHTPARV